MYHTVWVDQLYHYDQDIFFRLVWVILATYVLYRFAEGGTDALTKRCMSITKFAEPTGDMLVQNSVVLKLLFCLKTSEDILLAINWWLQNLNRKNVAVQYSRSKAQTCLTHGCDLDLRLMYGCDLDPRLIYGGDQGSGDEKPPHQQTLQQVYELTDVPRPSSISNTGYINTDCCGDSVVGMDF